MRKGNKIIILLLLVIITSVVVPKTFARYFSKFNETIVLNIREPRYKVVYDSNTGTGTMNEQNFVYGTSQVLFENLFTKEDNVFKGWNTKADGTGTSYQDGATVNNLTTTDDGTVTMYAQWYPPCNITYSGLSSSTTSLPESIVYGEELEIDFGDVNYNITTITMGNTTLSASDYTFNNNILTIASVTGDVAITVSEITADFIIVDNSDTTSIVSDVIANYSGGYVPMADYINMQFAGLNNSTKTINQIDVTFSYTAPTGSVQTTNLILVDSNGTEYTINVPWKAKQKKETSLTVSFTGLNIAVGDTFIIKPVANNHTNSSINIYSESILVHFSEN